MSAAVFALIALPFVSLALWPVVIAHHQYIERRDWLMVAAFAVTARVPVERANESGGRSLMSAELLRRAAAQVRERAEAATPGAWVSFAEEHRDHGGSDTYSHVLTADERTYVAQPDTEPDAEHIASWHPLVALAVADWLDAAANEEWCCDDCKFDPSNKNVSGIRALEVATRYLGESS